MLQADKSFAPLLVVVFPGGQSIQTASPSPLNDPSGHISHLPPSDDRCHPGSQFSELISQVVFNDTKTMAD